MQFVLKDKGGNSYYLKHMGKKTFGGSKRAFFFHLVWWIDYSRGKHCIGTSVVGVTNALVRVANNHSLASIFEIMDKHSRIEGITSKVTYFVYMKMIRLEALFYK